MAYTFSSFQKHRRYRQLDSIDGFGWMRGYVFVEIKSWEFLLCIFVGVTSWASAPPYTSEQQERM